VNERKRQAYSHLKTAAGVMSARFGYSKKVHPGAAYEQSSSRDSHSHTQQGPSLRDPQVQQATDSDTTRRLRFTE
jgi:hypothetical protein